MRFIVLNIITCFYAAMKVESPLATQVQLCPHKSFIRFQNLQVLSLEENRFKEVPFCVTKLRNLKSLYLNENRISRVHPK